MSKEQRAMKMNIALSILLLMPAALGSGCRSIVEANVNDPKIAVEKQPPAPDTNELLAYSVEGDDAGREDDAGRALTASLVDHVSYGLLRRGMRASSERPATRTVRLKVIEAKDVSGAARYTLGVAAGSDELYVDVQVLAGSPLTEIGLAHICFADSGFLTFSSINQGLMVGKVAETAVMFLSNGSRK
jgi:hypothetical protein